jgi:addiction module RelE/StbE family toxin
MEKIYKVIFADSVFNDFEQIPLKFLQHIIEKVENLESFPFMAPEVQSGKWSGYRQLIVDFYRVLYTVDQDKKIVLVNFAKHASMNIH